MLGFHTILVDHIITPRFSLPFSVDHNSFHKRSWMLLSSSGCIILIRFSSRKHLQEQHEVFFAFVQWKKHFRTCHLTTRPYYFLTWLGGYTYNMANSFKSFGTVGCSSSKRDSVKSPHANRQLRHPISHLALCRHGIVSQNDVGMDKRRNGASWWCCIGEAIKIGHRKGWSCTSNCRPSESGGDWYKYSNHAGNNFIKNIVFDLVVGLSS